MTKELKQQFTLRISQANKSQLVVILYEMMITYLDEAFGRTMGEHDQPDAEEAQKFDVKQFLLCRLFRNRGGIRHGETFFAKVFIV